MIGIIIMGILGLIFGTILVNLSEMMDNKEEEILNLLPGYNCGGCGYKGCEDLANHIAKDPELYKKCRVLKGENFKKMEEYIKENYNC